VTSTRQLRVLIVEDDVAYAELIVMELRRSGYEPLWQRVDTEPAYLKALDTSLDLVLSDLEMPVFDGGRALSLLHSRGLQIPFVIVSGAADEDTCLQLLRNGAADCLSKNRLSHLGRVVERAIIAQHRHD